VKHPRAIAEIAPSPCLEGFKPQSGNALSILNWPHGWSCIGQEVLDQRSPQIAVMLWWYHGYR